MSIKSFVAALAMVFMMCGSAFAAEKTYINGIDANYPPFAFLDETGKPTGFDVESMDWIAKKMGFKVEHRPMDWNGIIPSLLAKKIDMVASGMSISPERQAKVTFSNPYWSIRKNLVVKQESTLTKEDLLKGKKNLGVQSGTNEAEYLKQIEGKDGNNFTLRFYSSAPLAIQDLLNGRIDGGALDSAPTDEAIKSGQAIKVVGEFADPDDFGVATRNEDTELRNAINKGYELLMQDPHWEALKAKYINNK